MRAACACSGRPPTTTRCAWYEDRLAALRSRLCAFWCPPSACELKNLRRQKLQENTLCGGGLAADPDPDPDSESAEQLAASGDGDGDGDSLAPSVRFSHAAPSPCCSLVAGLQPLDGWMVHQKQLAVCCFIKEDEVVFLSFFHGEMGREPSSCSPLLVQAVTAMTSEPECAALGLVGWIGIPSQLDQDRKGETPRGSSSFQAPTYTLQYLQTCVIFGQICRSRCIFSSTNSVEHILTLKSVVA
ncbi:uncharacterized protein LOC100502453 [Zea mays]|uniref:uncharacterized protein LOC100502453 n=1 Tax=Zea mays TaxID=4577 RepID=UPI0009783624|nr:uncharacterized protein LOC100502453 [Zea mays]|eukprot:NP_001335402.1 uncharacterized protein LOC100502453 [Zea mays]